MPNLIFPDEDLVPVLNGIISLSNFTAVQLRLFVNNITIGPGSVAADPLEATFLGYAAQTLTFPAAALDAPNHLAYSTSNVAVYVSTDPGSYTVYGAYVIDPSSGKLLCGYNFTAPLTVDPINPAVVAQLKLTLQSKF